MPRLAELTHTHTLQLLRSPGVQPQGIRNYLTETRRIILAWISPRLLAPEFFHIQNPVSYAVGLDMGVRRTHGKIQVILCMVTVCCSRNMLVITSSIFLLLQGILKEDKKSFEDKFPILGKAKSSSKQASHSLPQRITPLTKRKGKRKRKVSCIAFR